MRLHEGALDRQHDVSAVADHGSSRARQAEFHGLCAGGGERGGGQRQHKRLGVGRMVAGEVGGFIPGQIQRARGRPDGLAALAEALQIQYEFNGLENLKSIGIALHNTKRAPSDRAGRTQDGDAFHAEKGRFLFYGNFGIRRDIGASVRLMI